MIETVLRAWADNAAAFAHVLADQDPSWGSTSFELADGWAVLCGPGLYVNRAMGMGIERPPTAADFERLEVMSTSVGVAASIEITPATHPTTSATAAERGYASVTTTSALRRGLDDAALLPVDPAFVIEYAGDQVATWQETSAAGWGHETVAGRRASDAFSLAAAVVDGQGFVIARDAVDRRPVACASLTVRDEVATLGGMSTMPTERRRGLQSALIHHRLRAAAAAGCSIATSTTEPGGASERNLVRHGFERWFTITTMSRAAAVRASSPAADR